MKIRSILPFALVAVLSTLNSNAGITGVSYWYDGDGAMVCPVYTWDGSDTVNIVGDQYWGPGHVLGDVTADGDPNLVLANSINNSTGFSWTGYIVDIWMSQPFTISNPLVTIPGDWTINPYNANGVWNGSVYAAQLTFSAGTPVAPGQTLSFLYTLSFNGSVSFTEQLTPVPEPGSLGLLLCGGLLLGGFKFARRRLS